MNTFLKYLENDKALKLGVGGLKLKAMRKEIKRLVFLMCFLWVPFRTTLAETETYKLSGNFARNQVIFHSRALMERFQGIAHNLSGTLNLDFDQPSLDLSGTIKVKVASIRTGNILRDQHMLSEDWFDADRHPDIHFTLSKPAQKSVKRKGPNVWFVKVRGLLTIKDRYKEVVVGITIKRTKNQNGNELQIKGGFPVHLSDFNIYGPRGLRMIGVKVSPDVRINLKLVGKRVYN